LIWKSYITTQSKILQSETLAMLTVKSMGLDNLPEFGGNPGETGEGPRAGSEASLHRPRVAWGVSRQDDRQTRSQQPLARRYL